VIAVMQGIPQRQTRLRAWLIALAAAAVLALVTWQWGSYGPFEVTVATTDRNLEQVAVTLAYIRPSGHGTYSTYKQTRTGRSNEPIRFPRGFVCFCASPPGISYWVVHPSLYGGRGEISSEQVRRIGVTRAPAQAPAYWPDVISQRIEQVLQQYPDSWTPPPGLTGRPVEALRADALDRDLRTTFDTYLMDLEDTYVKAGRPSQPQIASYMEEARRHLAALPISSRLKPPFEERLNRIEAALRARTPE
jgi:hypothetical protein